MVVVSTRSTWSIYRHGMGTNSSSSNGRVYSFLGRRQEGSVQVDADPVGNCLLESIQGERDSFFRVSSALISGQGRGMVAERIIVPGQEVCRVPIDCIVTPPRAVDMSAGLQALGEDVVAALPDWTILALYLVDVVMQKTNGRLDAAYADVLPRDECTGCVLEWSDDDVELLRGSHLYTIAREIRHAAELTMADVEALPCPEMYKDRRVLRWALSMLLTRVVRLGQDLQALCPGLDFFNHTSSSESFILLDEKKNDRVYVKADRLYMPGEQVMISYGNDKTTGELLLQYGFLPAASDTTYDACLFPIDILPIPNDVGAEGERDTNIRRRTVFPLTLQGFPEGILRHAAVVSMQEQQLDNNDDEIQDNIHRGMDGNLSQETRKRALKWLIGSMKERQRGMATSMEDAKRLAQQEELHTRRQNIGAVLLHEHRVLSKGQFMAQQLYRQL